MICIQQDGYNFINNKETTHLKTFYKVVSIQQSEDLSHLYDDILLSHDFAFISDDYFLSYGNPKYYGVFVLTKDFGAVVYDDLFVQKYGTTDGFTILYEVDLSLKFRQGFLYEILPSKHYSTNFSRQYKVKPTGVIPTATFTIELYNEVVNAGLDASYICLDRQGVCAAFDISEARQPTLFVPSERNDKMALAIAHIINRGTNVAIVGYPKNGFVRSDITKTTLARLKAQQSRFQSLDASRLLASEMPESSALDVQGSVTSCVRYQDVADDDKSLISSYIFSEENMVKILSTGKISECECTFVTLNDDFATMLRLYNEKYTEFKTALVKGAITSMLAVANLLYADICDKVGQATDEIHVTLCDSISKHTSVQYPHLKRNCSYLRDGTINVVRPNCLDISCPDDDDSMVAMFKAKGAYLINKNVDFKGVQAIEFDGVNTKVNGINLYAMPNIMEYTKDAILNLVRPQFNSILSIATDVPDLGTNANLNALSSHESKKYWTWSLFKRKKDYYDADKHWKEAPSYKGLINELVVSEVKFEVSPIMGARYVVKLMYRPFSQYYKRLCLTDVAHHAKAVLSTQFPDFTAFYLGSDGKRRDGDWDYLKTPELYYQLTSEWFEPKIQLPDFEKQGDTGVNRYYNFITGQAASMAYQCIEPLMNSMRVASEQTVLGVIATVPMPLATITKIASYDEQYINSLKEMVNKIIALDTDEMIKTKLDGFINTLDTIVNAQVDDKIFYLLKGKYTLGNRFNDENVYPLFLFYGGLGV